jgi:acyl dehydratase
MSMALGVGQLESVKRVFSQEDFCRFAALSGDDNPIHVDPEFAAGTTFGRTVAHGMLLYGAVSSVLGTRLPGPGTLQLEQELMFPAPTYVGEQVTIRLEVTRTDLASGLADITTCIIKPDDDIGLQGRALVRLPGATLIPGGLEQPPGAGHEAGEDVSFKGLEIGHTAEMRRVFTVADVDEYADLTGDTNPIFTDASYARRLGLVGTVIPGSLLGGLFSTLLGTRLPGRGTNYLKQRLAFLKLAYPGEEIRAQVEVIRLRPGKQLVNLHTVCRDVGEEVICEGEALVLVKDVQTR